MKLESFNRRKRLEVPLLALGILEVNSRVQAVQNLDIPEDILGPLETQARNTVTKAFDRLQKSRAPYATMEQLEAARDAFVAELALVPGPAEQPMEGTAAQPAARAADGPPETGEARPAAGTANAPMGAGARAPVLPPPLEPVGATPPQPGQDQLGQAAQGGVQDQPAPETENVEESRPGPLAIEQRASTPIRSNEPRSSRNGDTPLAGASSSLVAIQPPAGLNEPSASTAAPGGATSTAVQPMGAGAVAPAPRQFRELSPMEIVEIEDCSDDDNPDYRTVRAIENVPTGTLVQGIPIAPVGQQEGPVNRNPAGPPPTRTRSAPVARAGPPPAPEPAQPRASPYFEYLRSLHALPAPADAAPGTARNTAANPAAGGGNTSQGSRTGGQSTTSGAARRRRAQRRNAANAQNPPAPASAQPFTGPTNPPRPPPPGHPWPQAPQPAQAAPWTPWGGQPQSAPAPQQWAMPGPQPGEWGSQFTQTGSRAWPIEGQGPGTGQLPPYPASGAVTPWNNAFTGPGQAPWLGSVPPGYGPAGPAPSQAFGQPGPSTRNMGGPQGGAAPWVQPPSGGSGGNAYSQPMSGSYVPRGAPPGFGGATAQAPNGEGQWLGPPPGISSNNQYGLQQTQHDFYTMYNLQFPQPWRMPPPGEIPMHCRAVDPMRAIEKGLIKPFAGTVDDYPRFYNSFYNVVHIQPGPVLYKVLALDRLITDERTTRLFSGLGMSPADYVLRIERLEQHYGGPDRLQSYHLRLLRQLKGPIDKDFGNFEKYTNALVSYLRNAAVHEADNLVLRDQLKDAMSQGLALQYNQYLWAQRMPDNNRSIALFLSQRLDSEIRARESGKGAAADRTNRAMHEHAAVAHGEGILAEDPLPEQAQAHAAKVDARCACCQQGKHRLGQCEKFFLMGPTERRGFAARLGLCYICLESGHRSRACPGKKLLCSICGERHHYLLHPPPNASHMHQEEDLIDFQIVDTQQLSYGFQHAKDQPTPLQLDVALTYMTVWLRNPVTKQEVKVNLLADTGANTSCIDAELAQELGLNGPKEPYHVQVGGGRIHSYSSFLVTAEIQGVHDACTSHSIQLQAYKQPCGRLSRVDWAEAKARWAHLSELDLPAAADRPIQGIIGTQDFYLLAPVKPAVVGERNEPVAFESRLGWMIGGQVHPRPQHALHLHVMLMQKTERPCCHELRRALERMWTPDDSVREAHRKRATEPIALTALEQRAAEVFERTRRRQETGKYEVGLLWRNNIRPPRNYSAALSAFYFPGKNDGSSSRNESPICEHNKRLAK